MKTREMKVSKAYDIPGLGSKEFETSLEVPVLETVQDLKNHFGDSKEGQAEILKACNAYIALNARQKAVAVKDSETIKAVKGLCKNYRTLMPTATDAEIAHEVLSNSGITKMLQDEGLEFVAGVVDKQAEAA